MTKLSYAEAYTSFLAYCSSRESKTLYELMIAFKENGIEKEFKELYNINIKVSNENYYKILR